MTALDSVGLHRFLVHFTDTLTPELASHFANLPLDENFQKRLDALAQMATEGTLSKADEREYDTYFEAMDVVALLRVKTLAKSKSTECV